MALLPVADALARVLDGAAPLPAETVPLADAARPRARRRRRGAAHPAAGRRLGDGRLCGARRRRRERAGDAEGRSAKSRPGVRSPARSAPARRCASSPAAWCRPAPTPSSSRRTPTRDGDAVDRQRAVAARPAHPPRRARFHARRRAAAARPPAHRPRPDAGGGDEPPDACRCIAARRSRCSRPATSWCRPAARPGPARSSLPTAIALDGAGAARRRRRRSISASCRDQLDDDGRGDPPRARRRRRRPGHDRRRLGRRLRPGAEGARRRRACARLLEDRDAARQAADARPARRACTCSACPAIRSRPMSARCCSWCR